MSLRSINSRTWSKDYRSLVNWNDQQVSILDQIQSSNDNLTVVARAGCGKTSILTGIVGALSPDSSGNILAFNAHIADYLKGDKRIPSNRMKISTAHSYGLSMLKRVIDSPVIEKTKYNHLLEETLQEKGIQLEDLIVGTLMYKRSVAKDIKYDLQKLLTLCRCWVCKVEDIESINSVYTYYGYDFLVEPDVVNLLLEVVSKTLIKGRDNAIETGIIDFGDMIWLPNELDLKVSSHKDIVMMDEAQDANLCMMGIVEKLIGPSTRVVFMCDDRQEIYGFNGSVPGICSMLNTKFNTKLMPLTYCYRCPESHLELVRDWVPDIVCGKTNKDGSVIRTSPQEMDGKYRPGMVIVGRFNSPLIELGVRLLTKGMPVYIPHKDITQSFISLMDTVRDMSMEQASYVIEERMHKELGKVKGNDSKGNRKVKNILDKYEGCLFLIETLGGTHSNIHSVIRFLEGLQSKPVEESIRITTVHSFKGGEADDVVVLDSNEMPYFRLCSTDWEMSMEENVAYVAHTRSKNNLYLVNKEKK